MTDRPAGSARAVAAIPARRELAAEQGLASRIREKGAAERLFAL